MDEAIRKQLIDYMNGDSSNVLGMKKRGPELKLLVCRAKNKTFGLFRCSCLKCKAKKELLRDRATDTIKYFGCTQIITVCWSGIGGILSNSLESGDWWNSLYIYCIGSAIGTCCSPVLAIYKCCSPP